MNTIKELKQQEKYNNMLKRKNKEIERLNAELELYKDNEIHLNKLLEQKDNIIKEAKDYIDNHQLVFELSNKKQIIEWFDMFYKELLEILDKENK